MPYEFVGDLDVSKVVFKPLAMDKGIPRVEIAKDASTKSKFFFNLCKKATEPFELRYRLDSVQEGSDGSRRGLSVKIQDEQVKKVLQELDEAVVAAGVANCKEWFKKSQMSEMEVRARHKPLLVFSEDNPDECSLKFKVKCAQYKTKLHLLQEGNNVVMNGATLDDLNERTTRIAPILSIYSVYFMGGGSQFGISIQAEEMFVLPGAKDGALSNFLGEFNVVNPPVADPVSSNAVQLEEEESGEPDAKRVRLEEDA
jgi:hypothetical protein